MPIANVCTTPTVSHSLHHRGPYGKAHQDVEHHEIQLHAAEENAFPPSVGVAVHASAFGHGDGAGDELWRDAEDAEVPHTVEPPAREVRVRLIDEALQKVQHQRRRLEQGPCVLLGTFRLQAQRENAVRFHGVTVVAAELCEAAQTGMGRAKYTLSQLARLQTTPGGNVHPVVVVPPIFRHEHLEQLEILAVRAVL